MKIRMSDIRKTGRLIPFCLASIVQFGISSYASAELVEVDDRWELALEKKQVKIYTREFEGSDIEAFKAETILNNPINNIMSVMANPNSCVEWVHGCVVSFGFDEVSFNKRYAYSVNDLPWPVQDRDYVLEINTTSDPATGQIMMEMHAVDGKKPVSSDYHRTTVAQTYYVFTPTEDNKTHMLWLQHTEPGGVLPSWLVNNLLVDIPYQSLKKLDEVAGWDKYQNGKITYNSDGIISGVQMPSP